jgi:RHS repeat-associated protein
MRDEVAGQNRYYHFDHQGTVQCLTDSTGAVTDRFASDAWGVQVKRTGSSINRQWYIGNWGYYRQVDQVLDYVRARYLAPSLGAWLSHDWDLTEPYYQYVSNRPSLLADPTGTNPDTYWCMIIGIYGRTQHVGDPPKKLGIVYKILNSLPAELKKDAHDFNSEIGSDRMGHYILKNGILGGGNTRDPHNKIIQFIKGRPEYKNGGCVCIVSYSWGVGQTLLLMDEINKAPKLVVPVLITIEGLQVQPPHGAPWDPTHLSVRNAIDRVQRHYNWYAGKPYKKRFLGIPLDVPFGGSRIAKAITNTVSPGRHHSSINDDPTIPPAAVKLLKQYCRRPRACGTLPPEV